MAAYLLAAMNTDGSKPTADNLAAILSSVGVEADRASIDLVIAAFKDVSAEDAVSQGLSLLSAAPGGGGGASSGGAPAAAAAEEAAPAKEEKKEESEEESDDDMGFGLFD